MKHLTLCEALSPTQRAREEFPRGIPIRHVYRGTEYDSAKEWAIHVLADHDRLASAMGIGVNEAEALRIEYVTTRDKTHYENNGYLAASGRMADVIRVLMRSGLTIAQVSVYLEQSPDDTLKVLFNHKATPSPAAVAVAERYLRDAEGYATIAELVKITGLTRSLILSIADAMGVEPNRSPRGRPRSARELN